MQRTKHAPIIMIEGNIGAGKSTFLKVLKKHLDADIIFEPTNKWQSVESENNLLEMFYKDTPRWAYTFQSYAFISRVQTILDYQAKNPSSGVQFLERSVYCDRYCFAKNCYESGLMTKLEWNIYKEWFSWLVEKHTPVPSGFIYLQTDPEVCYRRINKRNRHEESAVPLKYLQSLHERHEDWLINKKELTPQLELIPTLTLDCNKEFETNLAVQKRHITAIQSFIDEKVLPCHAMHGQVITLSRNP